MSHVGGADARELAFPGPCGQTQPVRRRETETQEGDDKRRRTLSGRHALLRIFLGLAVLMAMGWMSANGVNVTPLWWIIIVLVGGPYVIRWVRKHWDSASKD